MDLEGACQSKTTKLVCVSYAIYTLETRTETLGPTKVREPMVIRHVSKKTELKLMKTFFPRRTLVP